jgi:hypothetical protein
MAVSSHPLPKAALRVTNNYGSVNLQGFPLLLRTAKHGAIKDHLTVIKI